MEGARHQQHLRVDHAALGQQVARVGDVRASRRRAVLQEDSLGWDAAGDRVVGHGARLADRLVSALPAAHDQQRHPGAQSLLVLPGLDASLDPRAQQRPDLPVDEPGAMDHDDVGVRHGSASAPDPLHRRLAQEDEEEDAQVGAGAEHERGDQQGPGVGGGHEGDRGHRRGDESQAGRQAQQVAQAPALAADEDDAVEHEQERHEGDEQEEGDTAQTHRDREDGDEGGQVEQCSHRSADQEQEQESVAKPAVVAAPREPEEPPPQRQGGDVDQRSGEEPGGAHGAASSRGAGGGFVLGAGKAGPSRHGTGRWVLMGRRSS